VESLLFLIRKQGRLSFVVLSCYRVVKLRSSPRLHRSILFLSGRRHLLGRSHVLGALLGKIAGVRGAVAEPFAVEVEDVGGDDERDRGGGEDEAGDRELPLGAGLDLGVEGGGVERGDAGQEVAAEAVAAGGRGGVFAVGGDLGWESVIEAWLGGGGGAGLTM
jgi:hypothetical protein